MRTAAPAKNVLDVRVEILVEHLERNASGRGNALRARAINARLGYNERTCRALVQEANRAGVLVAADNVGYFIPATAEEVDQAIGRLRSQAFEMLSRAHTLARLAATKFNRPAPKKLQEMTLFDLGLEDDDTTPEEPR
jgi:hypothetical protein